MPNDSLLQVLLSKATTPLTTLPTQAGEAASGYLNDKGWGRTGAFAEALGHGVSDMTSPLSLGLSALGPLAGKLLSKAAPVAGKVAGEIPARTWTGPVAETLGEVNPDFTPVGGEGMFNAPRVKTMPNLQDELYQRALEKFGMGR